MVVNDLGNHGGDTSSSCPAHSGNDEGKIKIGNGLGNFIFHP